MATRLQVTIDCNDPARLVRFWATALRYDVPAPPDGFSRWSDYWRSLGLPEHEVDDSPSAIVDPDGVGPRLFFQPVPEAKVVKNRLHLDLDAGGGRATPLDVRISRIEAEADRLVTAGATRLRVLDEVDGHYALVMADPESNEFCLH